MRSGVFIALALTLSAAGLAAAPPSKSAPPKVMQSCDAHQFETTVTATVDGEPHQSKVKLCGVEGQSDADWIKTLKDAIAKLDTNKEVDPAVRQQIVTAINAEIGRLSILSSGALVDKIVGIAATGALPPPRKAPNTSVSSDYAALPPLPSTPPPPPHVLAPAVPDGSPVTKGSAAQSYASMPLMGPPRKLSFACFSPNDLSGDGPCTGFERETMLTVRADEDLPKPAQLRFIRNGEEHGDIDLEALRRGKSVRVALPRELCQGFGSGKLELQVLENGVVVKSDGPYSLRC
jgi:hypothetical protein